MEAFLDSAEFIRKFCEEMEITSDLDVTLDSRLIEDLGFDSLQMMLAFQVILDSTGSDDSVADSEMLAAFDTLRGVHNYYLTRCSMPSGEDDRLHAQSISTPPKLSNSLISLSPPHGAHFGRLYEIAISNDVAWRWRYGGAMPSYDEFLRTFSNGVLTQLVVASRMQPEVPIGLVVAYNANLANRTAYLAVVMAPEHTGAGLGAMAAVMFLKHVFFTWDFHKIYIEMPEFNFGQFSSGAGREFRLEGRLRGHTFYAGRRWDHLVFAVYRHEFVERWISGPLESTNSWGPCEGDPFFLQ
jgi:RimJ/RimL family protein N-acetyltransferase/acyl carrier protein